MSGFFNVGDNSSSFMSDFFSNSGVNNSSGLGYGDYAMIKSGAYKKLVKNYYANSKEGTANVEDDSKQKSEAKKLVSVKGDADLLSKDASGLRNSKLFEGTYNSETNTTEYNRDEIYKKVNSLISDYNSMLDSAAEVEDKGTLKKTLYAISETKTFSNLLNEVGITIGKDNKLSIDKDKFNGANMTTLKTIFSGPNSLTDKLATKANDISKNLSVGKSGSYYSSTGEYIKTGQDSSYSKLL
ncbi:MAG: hypothetical protein K6G65_03645 [Lachnospiraceae bacterium]|nr:hypothetical protein [Lachnospiraceae bacterium]